MKERRRFLTKYGPRALIAGGSDGIGAEFARQLAALGMDLVLVGRREQPLFGLAEELAGRHGVDVHTLRLDLAERSQIRELFDETEALDIGLVVTNAALSLIGDFVDQSSETHERMLDLNCRMPLLLAHEFGRRLSALGRGGIVLLSSMAAFQGTVLTAHYAATKAYLRVLAEGLWAELRPFGVDVVASCPGTVNTPTFLRDEPISRRWASLPVMEVAPTVSDTLRALGRTPVVVPGRIDRIASFVMQRILPRKTLIRLTARATRGMYPHQGGRSAPGGDGNSFYREAR